VEGDRLSFTSLRDINEERKKKEGRNKWKAIVGN